MTKDSCFCALDKLSVHFGSVTMQQKEDYYTHLRGYTDAEMSGAVFTIVDSRRWKSFPFISEVRAVLDKIRFDCRSEPTPSEAASYYDQFPCSSCAGTGFIVKDTPAGEYKPGMSSAVALFCQCRIGQVRENGWRAFREKKRMKRRVEFERRYEAGEEA